MAEVTIEAAELDRLRAELATLQLERDTLGRVLLGLIESWKAETLRSYERAETGAGLRERVAWRGNAAAIEQCVTDLFGKVVGFLPGVQRVAVQLYACNGARNDG